MNKSTPIVSKIHVAFIGGFEPPTTRAALDERKQACRLVVGLDKQIFSVRESIAL